MFYKLVYEYRLSPLLSSHIANMVAALSYTTSYRRVYESSFRVLGGLDRSITFVWSAPERRLKYIDQGTGLSIDYVSLLRIPLGSLESLSIQIILDGLRAINNLESFRDVNKLLVIDEFGIHCDPLLLQRLLDRVVSETFSLDKSYTVVITHNPDVLTRSLRLIEKEACRNKSVLDLVSIHQFLWDENTRSIVVDSFGVKYVDGMVVPSKKIKVFEESFDYLNK